MLIRLISYVNKIVNKVGHFICAYVGSFLVCFLLMSYGIFSMKSSNRVHSNMKRYCDIWVGIGRRTVFEAQYKGSAEGTSMHLHMRPHRKRHFTYHASCCISLSLKAAKCSEDFFSTVLLFKCIIRIVAREEPKREKTVPE